MFRACDLGVMHAYPLYIDLATGPTDAALVPFAVALTASLAGIPVLAEGAIAQGVPNGGFYVTPTLFGQVPRGNRLEQEEVFGPVLAAFSFDDEEDAVKLANSTPYGLVAGVWTNNGGRQQRVAKRVRAGQVFINGYGAGGGIELPFGGTGKSGHGREKGFMALEEFAVAKTIVHKHG